jgi:hypothetical protein
MFLAGIRKRFQVKKRQDCRVAIAPRNDIRKTVFVIASEAKQSQANAGSPRIAGILHLRQAMDSRLKPA